MSEGRAARLVATLTGNSLGAELAGMWPGMTAGEFGDLVGLVDLAVGAGFRPVWIETATVEEWEDFESGYQCVEEEWFAARGDHPKAAETRE